ncbi:hypothetical protein KU6B_36490 [Mameliella alba]|uniref:hypothetical protein n=1 Tax=Mameliella alba TaxID=561184 RepID=UPI000B5338E7|nr:hypothetical protein [Mameliella alba]OWV68327.1 hypothetical protein CDZ97_00720 [Mameliella alba]BBU57384.1 hypothetical protein KU6B_36490 [Mameliella alba]
MTLNMHARLTADGKQAQAELAKTGQGARGLKTEVDALGQSGQEASADFVALQKQLEAYKVDLVNLRNEHAAAKKQIDGLRGELTKLKTQAGQAQADIGKTAQAAGHLGDEIEDVGRKAPRANQAASAFAGGGLRQMSMQFSQVAQQGAVTGNYLQALAIQAPDLGLGFGTVGIAVGALVPILFGLSQGLFDVGEETEDLTDQLDALEAAVKKFQNASRDGARGLTDLRDEYGALTDEAQAFFEIQRELARINAQQAFGAAMGGLAEAFSLGSALGLSPRQVADQAKALRDAQAELDRLNAGVGEFSDKQMVAAIRRTKELRKEIRDLRDVGRAIDQLAQKFNISAEAATEFAKLLSEVDAAKGPEEQAAAAQKLAQHLYDATDGLKGADKETISLYQNLLDVVKSGLDFASLDLSSGVGAAADEAARLADNLARASLADTMARNMAGAAAADAARRFNENLPKGMTTGTGITLLDLEYGDWTPPGGPPREPKRSGGGGRSAKTDRDAVRDLIAAKQDELALLRESDPIQQEMIRLREDLAGATEGERRAVAGLIASIQEEELAKAQAAETSEFFRSSMADLIPDLVRGGDDAASAWQRLARSLEDAAWQALLLGEGPLMGLVGTLFGITGGGGGGLLGWVGGLLGFADGGMHYGRGGPRADKELVRVSPGEFTVNAEGTQRHRPLLEAINAGAPIPGFASGGAHGGGSYAAPAPRVSLNLYDQTSRGIRLEQVEETGPDGSRQTAFVASDMVNDAMNLPGGKARRSLRRKGLREPLVRT